MRIEICKECNKRFSVTEMGAKLPGTKESEEIECPYCGYAFKERSNGVFRTHRIEDASDRSD